MSNIQMNDNNQRTRQNVTSQNNTFVWNDRILKEKLQLSLWLQIQIII